MRFREANGRAMIQTVETINLSSLQKSFAPGARSNAPNSNGFTTFAEISTCNRLAILSTVIG